MSDDDALFDDGADGDLETVAAEAAETAEATQVKPETWAASSLSQSQRARMERNRLKAISLKRARITKTTTTEDAKKKKKGDEAASAVLVGKQEGNKTVQVRTDTYVKAYQLWYTYLCILLVRRRSG